MHLSAALLGCDVAEQTGTRNHHLQHHQDNNTTARAAEFGCCKRGTYHQAVVKYQVVGLGVTGQALV
jgi:hypothetical protein